MTRTLKLVYTNVMYTKTEVVDGVPVMEEVVKPFPGKLDKKKAMKKLREIYGDNVILYVDETEEITERRSISYENLIKYSEVVKEKDDADEEVNEEQ